MAAPKRKPVEWAPWLPVDYKAADVSAIQALKRGDATPEQQRRAFDWIVLKAASTAEETFHPDNARWSDFAQGKRFVGMQILKCLQLSTSALANQERQKRGEEPRPSEQPP